MESGIVGKPLNFRGLIYSPINEQGVVYLFGLIAEDLNIRIESIQQGYPDCTAIRFLGGGKWQRIRIEFEYLSSGFNHDPRGCDVIVCWEDDLSKEAKEKLKGLQIIELKSTINTPEVPNKELKDPDKKPDEKSEFTLEHHYKRKNVLKPIQTLYEKLDKAIQQISPDVWRKYAKTAITYYCPERNFVYVSFRKTKIRLHIFTNQEKIEGVKNIQAHENWGEMFVSNEKELSKAIAASKKSFDLIKYAIQNNINTGWYAVTPKERMPWLKEKT